MAEFHGHVVARWLVTSDAHIVISPCVVWAASFFLEARIVRFNTLCLRIQEGQALSWRAVVRARIYLPERELPLSRWTAFQSFNSADNCEITLAGAIKGTAKDRIEHQDDPNNGKNILAQI